jgi:putative FmdB family regulatory protein
MPTYEYRCEACGHEFEKFQSITDPAVRKCPQCGRLKVRRLISAGGGVIFKGSGFYGTDYRSESYKKAEKEDKKGAEAKSGDKDSKGDSKKEEKAGSKKKEDKK